MTRAAIADRLRRLAGKVGRLRPDWRDPETYFANRDELERELRRIASEAEHGL